MKNILFVILACTTVLLTVASCSKDDDASKKPEDNLPEEARSFVGYWEFTGELTGAAKWMFFSADGKCVLANGAYAICRGSWSYDKDTKVLATDISNFQYIVTLSTPSSWAATYYKQGSPYSVGFRRLSDDSAMSLILFTLSTSYFTQTEGEKNLLYEIDDNNADITYVSNDGDDFVYKVSYYHKYFGRYSGELVINNMYNFSKLSLIITIHGDNADNKEDKYSSKYVFGGYYW